MEGDGRLLDSSMSWGSVNGDEVAKEKAQTKDDQKPVGKNQGLATWQKKKS